MRKAVLPIILLVCLMIMVSCLVLVQSNSSIPIAYGALQSSSLSSKDVYGPLIYKDQVSSSPLFVTIPNGWEVTSLSMSFSGIKAPNTTFTLEEEPFKGYKTNISRAMSFQLPEGQKAYLYGISLYLLHFPLESPPPGKKIKINVSLYNATHNPSLDAPYPDKLLNSTIVYFPVVTGPVGWKEFRFSSSVALGPQEANTYKNTYFVVVRNETMPYKFGFQYRLYWFFAPDNGTENKDKGYAYHYNEISGSWDLEKYNDSGIEYYVDYCLRVKLSVNNESDYWEVPFPTEIAMSVNGTSVENCSARGEGFLNLSQNLNTSENPLTLNISSRWVSPINYGVTIYVYGVDVASMLYAQTIRNLTAFFYFYNYTKDAHDKFLILLGIIALGAVLTGGYGGRVAYKRRKVPLNALGSLENIMVDHNPSGTLIWAYDFISMEQDLALVSGFMSAVKSFLEEMQKGGLKRLGTEFGTFIREEGKILTATCVTSDIGLDEELWIRGKLHQFLLEVEEKHWEQLEDWKGDVSQFRESFAGTLSSVIDLEKAREQQIKKISRLKKDRVKLQSKLNKLGSKLEQLKSKYESGELSYENYIVKRVKLEAKYDEVQKDYVYANLFLSKVPPELAEEKVSKAKLKKIESIRKRFLEIRTRINELKTKEATGTLTSEDLKEKDRLEKELTKLIKKLEELQ